MGKTIVINVKLCFNGACYKLLNKANVGVMEFGLKETEIRTVQWTLRLEKDFSFFNCVTVMYATRVGQRSLFLRTRGLHYVAATSFEHYATISEKS